MKTPSTHPPLTADQRGHLRAHIDHAVRARIGKPTEPCPECGADTRLISTPVRGCTTCANRFWRRRQRRR